MEKPADDDANKENTTEVEEQKEPEVKVIRGIKRDVRLLFTVTPLGIVNRTWNTTYILVLAFYSY